MPNRGPAVSAASRRGTLAAVSRPGAFDAVVVGAGATGGLATLLLAEAGLGVLLLDAGEPVSRWSALVRAGARRVESAVRGTRAVESRRRRQPIQSQSYAWPMAPHAFVDDRDFPYETPPGKPFVWIRSRGLGGRLLVPGHGRQYYRMGPGDLAPADGLSPPWPVTYDDLEPWYAKVEVRLGMSGGQEGIPWLPDSIVSQVTTPTEGEAWIRERVAGRWPRAHMAMGRFAEPRDFLEQAAETGRLTVREGAVARDLEVDREGNVRGVTWVDLRSRRTERVAAPLIFLCASALETTRVLLASRSPYGTVGLGARSGSLGAHLMDHVRVLLRGTGPAFPTSPLGHQRCLYLPRFDSRGLDAPHAGRGFGVQVNHGPASNGAPVPFALSAYGEMLPSSSNRVRLHPSLKDAVGIPVLQIECSHGPSEIVRAEDQRLALLELADALDVKVSHLDATAAPPGLANHECGTARMGLNPEDSVVDANNECWEARGLFVVDGACLPSQGTQNPTLTYLALTARACAHAVSRAAR